MIFNFNLKCGIKQPVLRCSDQQSVSQPILVPMLLLPSYHIIVTSQSHESQLTPLLSELLDKGPLFPSQISLSDCCEAHRRTRLTKGHVISNLGDEGPRHPKKDEKEGVEVPRDSVSYLLAVYSVLPPGNTLLPYISLFSEF